MGRTKAPGGGKGQERRWDGKDRILGHVMLLAGEVNGMGLMEKRQTIFTGSMRANRAGHCSDATGDHRKISTGSKQTSLKKEKKCNNKNQTKMESAKPRLIINQGPQAKG